jgi:hypothetical protein
VFPVSTGMNRLLFFPAFIMLCVPRKHGGWK